MSQAASIVPHFRRLPALTRGEWDRQPQAYPAERQQHCAERFGHILTILDNRIVCVNCGATWKDEGF